MKQTIFLTYLALVIAWRVQSSLLCNGDFETYVIPVRGEAINVPSNYSCWYERSGGVFEVQKKFGSTTTKVMELAVSSPNVVCQNVTTLVVGNMYQLNFSVLNGVRMNFSEVKVLLNSQLTFQQVYELYDIFKAFRS